MHLRKQLVIRVAAGELTISRAAREYGVSRNTAKLWIRRAQEGPLAELGERSRRPLHMPRSISAELEAQVLDLKASRPVWGAKKIHRKLWPEDPPMSARTVDRILDRHGLVERRGRARPEQRFERGRPNELLQIDFKALGRMNPGYSPLSVLDDATRFCLAFEPLPDHRSDTIWEFLWRLFGEYGLPDAILTDNEPCFAERTSAGPSRLESRLWLLGVDALHGRPAHPQTQGKVERFHRTVQLELGRSLRQGSIEEAKRRFDQFRHEYNYERPHEAIGLRVPGRLYRASRRERPDRLPEHEPGPGSSIRKVTYLGSFQFRGTEYRGGRGLGGQYVELREEQQGHGVYFAGRRFADLEQLRW